MRKLPVAIAATTLVAGAIPVVALTASAAHADGVEKSRTCAGAQVQLDVDRENGRYEVDADIDRATVGSTWKVVVRHNGKVLHSRQHRADYEGDIEFGTTAPNTSGADTFTLTVTPAGGTGCSLKISAS